MIADKYPQWGDDFERRVGVLKTIRQQFLAFIVDEYQDTNPAHFRLLARLWGSRRINQSSQPHGPWDPTICVVGDMKQSIYRFRQAEVTVMRRTVEHIKRVNGIEFANTSFEFRDLDFGRDPRPIAGKDVFRKSPKSSSELPLNRGQYNTVPLNETDLEVTIEDPSLIEKRRSGHIDLTSNFRTAHDLLNTLNQLFGDVFDPRHHSLPGDYHAKAQPLQPAKQDAPYGKLEWLMPMALENMPQPENELFNQPNPKSFQLEHEMIALRLQNLIQGKPCNIWNSSKQEYMKLEQPKEIVNPSDITILIHSRTHIADLINRLQARGIPVISDKQGQLLEQPIVANLMSTLDLVANPSSKFAAATVAKSPIIGLTDKELTQLFSLIDKDRDGTINQEEFGNFVATTLPPGTVIPPAAIALGFQVLDTDRTGSLSISDILGTQGEIITTAAKIVSEEIKEEPIEQNQISTSEEIEVEEEIIQEEIVQEEIVDQESSLENEHIGTLDSESISSKLSEARFSSEKNRIIEAMKGNPIEFDVSINRVRSEGTSNKPMEVEVSALDGSNYIISIDSSKISSLQSSLEKKSGTVRISGSVLGFNMARNCVTINISQIE